MPPVCRSAARRSAFLASSPKQLREKGQLAVAAYVRFARVSINRDEPRTPGASRLDDR